MATGVSKQQRHKNFLAGRARSTHRLPISLEQSIVEDNPAPSPSSSSSSQQLPSCKRGCPQILTGLKPAFEAAGLHPAKTLQKRLASYPVPKKQKVAHRNTKGSYTACIAQIILNRITSIIIITQKIHLTMKLYCSPSAPSLPLFLPLALMKLKTSG